MERGCIAEERVLGGELDSDPDFVRLTEADERIVLHSMHKQIVDRSLCLRGVDPGGRRPRLLVFPSYFRRERPERPIQPEALMTWRLDGYLDAIHASLVVRLHHAERFDSAELWRNAADFTTADRKTIGVRLTPESDGTARLELHCDPVVT